MCKEDFCIYKDLICFSTVFPGEHLRQIEITKFKGKKDEVKLVGYFLQHGKSLKKMTLHRAIEPLNSLKAATAYCHSENVPWTVRLRSKENWIGLRTRKY